MKSTRKPNAPGFTSQASRDETWDDDQTEAQVREECEELDAHCLIGDLMLMLDGLGPDGDVDEDGDL